MLLDREMNTTYIAILRVRRPGKGKGQRTSLKLYDKAGNLLREHNGPKANAIAGSLRKAGIQVNLL